MSGGSYNYLFEAAAADLLGSYSKRSDLENMAERLSELGYASDAAAEAYELLAIIRQADVRIDVAMRRLREVFQAVEWWDSNDSGEEGLERALASYRTGVPKRITRRE